MDIRYEIEKNISSIIELRREFHRIPELGYEEFKTSAKITSYLEELGLNVFHYNGTGLAAVINSENDGPMLMLRADIDALAGNEETGLPFSSTHPGKMHACGHDAHIAGLLGAAKILCEHADELKGRVLLVFEPNEERSGALNMIKDGLLERFPAQACFGMHVWPGVPLGKISVAAGPVMAGTMHFRITVNGQTGHTGSPHLAKDPILCSAAVLQNLQMIQTREIDIQKPTLIMVGKIEGGVLPNIIPDKVDMYGTCRHLYEMSEEENLRARMERVVKSTTEAYGMSGEIEWRENFPALVNDSELSKIARVAAEDYMGEGSVVECRYTAGDDFAEFARLIPGVYCHIGTGHSNGEGDYSLHHPMFTIDEAVLKDMVGMWIKLTTAWFDSHQ
ncbi:MAG: M20 family metallopeptidase [Oscillospiraceae bacterium]|nr:M20 family metallopeptidase [Oscillospiraceae bacterium]